MSTDLNKLYAAIEADAPYPSCIVCANKFYELAKNSDATPNDWHALNTQYWVQLLAYVPLHENIKEYFDFGRLDGEDWSFLLCENEKTLEFPAFDPEIMSAEDWLQVLSLYPDHISSCPEHIMMDAIKAGTITPKIFGTKFEWYAENTIVIGRKTKQFGGWLLQNNILLTDEGLKDLQQESGEKRLRYFWAQLVICKPEILQHRLCPIFAFTQEDWEEITKECETDFKKFIPEDLFASGIHQMLKMICDSSDKNEKKKR